MKIAAFTDSRMQIRLLFCLKWSAQDEMDAAFYLLYLFMKMHKLSFKYSQYTEP